MQRRSLALATLAALGALASPLTRAQAPVDGRQFTTLRGRQRPRDDGRIEVLEFFSYGCPACNAFDPVLERWAKALPRDVAFRRVPVPFLVNAQNFQRAFYALEATGAPAPVHGRIFEAVHVEKRRLSTPEEIADVVARGGGDRAKFLDAFGSFSMSAHLARGKAAAEACQIDSIPTLVIGGRFKTSPEQANGASEALSVAGYLIERARKA